MKLYTQFVYSTLYLSSAFAQTCNYILKAENGCINLSVAAGTGCAWMCQYCANALGTNNYYFTDSVCTYQQGTGCVGNPQAGKTYTCCSV